MSTIIEVQPSPGGGSVSITEAAIPAGGTTGQVLSKLSAADYDVQWSTVSGGGSVAWADITGKPSTFTPSAHSHVIADVTGLQSALDGKQASGSYAAATHTHIIGDVTGLQAALDGKQAAGSYLTANQTITLSGDASGSGATGISVTLATVNASPQTDTFRKITVSGKGLVTATSAVTSGDITTALGFTPYNSTNPSGYTSNLGTVTSVSGTGTVSGLSLSGTVTNSGNITLGGTLSVSASNFASQTANTFLAAPNGAAGVPTFRAIVAADIPTLNQSTTGSAATLTTGRTIGMTGDVTWTSASFNGSGNVTGTSTIGNNVVSLAKMATVATGTFLGRVTASTGNVEALTGTQATTLLDVFTTSLKGLVPASGGGTTNFLRADGTWAAPSGGGGGGSGDVVGPASATDEAIARFDGTTGKLLQDSGVKITDNGSLVLPENSNPTASGAGEMKLFCREIANRLLPAFIGPSGLDSTLQPLLARNKIGYWCPPGNATTVPGVLGFTAPTTTGFTATARNVATTNRFTRMRRLGYATAATAGTVGQWRVAFYQYTVGSNVTNEGGFTYIIRFGISDAAAVSGARMFMGMRSSATPANVEPSTLTNCIGIGHGASDTTMKLFYGGSAAQTPIDLGANFPADTRSTDIYELALFSAPNSGDVHYEVTRVNTGDVATGTITNSGSTVLPTNTTLIAPWGYRTNNATALAVGLDVMSAYIETDT